MSNIIRDIKENYLKMERELVTQLNYDVTNHQLTAGSYREEIWVNFFTRIVPKKFNIARSVFIIDSNQNVSKEVDIAIYDEQYTPYIFNYGLIKFIPVEAVAAVVQCKSRNLNTENLEEWADSIDVLKTSNDSIVRLATYIHIGNIREDGSKNSAIQTATRPIKILCYIPVDETNTDDSKGRNKFDIVIEAYQNSKSDKNKDKNTSKEVSHDGNLKITFADKDLLEVLQKYNQADKDDNLETKDEKFKKLKERKIGDYEVSDKTKKYTLLSFIFQFNQILMMINNPMFFPHKAYVDMFNNDIQEE